MTFGILKNMKTAVDVLQKVPKRAANEPLVSFFFASWAPGAVPAGARAVQEWSPGMILWYIGLPRRVFGANEEAKEVLEWCPDLDFEGIWCPWGGICCC